jgi:hypothetical protein
VLVSGYVAAADTVLVNDVTATLTGTTFVASVDLVDGVNTITATATGAAGSVSDTVHVTLDTTAPTAPDVQVIATGLRSGAPTTVIGFAGSVEADAQVTVTNSRTGETVTASADHAGEFLASVTAQAGDTLSIVVTDRAGNTGPPGTKQVGNVIVSVTSTVLGATVAGGEMTVRGTLLPVPNGMVGVTANGTPGLVEGNQFVIRLPVDASATTSTLTVRDFSGVLSAVAIPVTITAASAPAIVLRATRSAGLIPLTTAFEYSSPVAITQVALDADGDGTDDTSGTTFDGFSFTYTHAGLYLPRLTVTDANGNVYTTVGIVHAADSAAMDARLQPVWQGVKDALRVGDVTSAAAFIHSDTRATYQNAFGQLAPIPVNIDQIMTTIQLVDVGFGGAQCKMFRDRGGQTYSFAAWFKLDQDGLWRLSRF